MAEDPHANDGIEHPSIAYERTDVNLRWILAVLATGALLAVIIHLSVWGFFREERHRLSKERVSQFPLAPGPSTAVPPEPRLEQLDRLLNIQTSNPYVRQQAAERYLHSFGTTKDDGFVHVPIDLAIQYLATKKPLPARTEPPPKDARDNGLVDWGEPNSGRLFNRRPPPWLER